MISLDVICIDALKGNIQTFLFITAKHSDESQYNVLCKQHNPVMFIPRNYNSLWMAGVQFKVMTHAVDI